MMHASGQGPPNMAIRNGHMMQKSSQCAGQWPVNCLTRRWFDTTWVSENMAGTRKMYIG